MLKPSLALAVPALVLGVGLAETSPAKRAAVLDSLRGSVSAPADLSASALPPTPPNAGPEMVGGASTSIEANRVGQFEADMDVSGRRLPILIDTGATFVSLNSQDAATIGIYPRDADYRYTVQTANGAAKVAAVMIPRIRVGNVEAHDVQAVVSRPGALQLRNLLGMSFLNKLSGFRVEGGRLLLRQ